MINSENAQKPALEIRVRPKKQDLGMFNVNNYIKHVEKELFEESVAAVPHCTQIKE